MAAPWLWHRGMVALNGAGATLTLASTQPTDQTVVASPWRPTPLPRPPSAALPVPHAFGQDLWNLPPVSATTWGVRLAAKAHCFPGRYR